MLPETASELWGSLPLADAVLEAFGFVGNSQRLQEIFDSHRGRCYDDLISFPLMVSLMADALLEHGGSANQSFSRARETGELSASKVAAYGKLGRLPVRLSQAFVTGLARPIQDIFPAAARAKGPTTLAEFCIVILDGKAIKNVAHRLKPLRGTAGGLLGGKALVAIRHDTGMIVAMEACEDGDANEVQFVPRLLPTIRTEVQGPRLYLVDSGFCDLLRMNEFTQEGDHFLVRRHPKVGFHPDPERPAQTGIDSQGREFVEEWGWMGATNHPGRRYVRCIRLKRSGEKDIAVVTDLLDSTAYPAIDLLKLYLERWGIERVFQKVTDVFHLERLIGSTPKATIFQLAFCLILYNVILLIRGVVSAHQSRPADSISIENLFYDAHRELTTWSVLVTRGFPLNTIPLAASALMLARRLDELLSNEWSDRWIKATNKQRRCHVPKPNKRTHSSVHRILTRLKQNPGS